MEDRLSKVAFLILLSGLIITGIVNLLWELGVDINDYDILFYTPYVTVFLIILVVLFFKLFNKGAYFVEENETSLVPKDLGVQLIIIGCGLIILSLVFFVIHLIDWAAFHDYIPEVNIYFPGFLYNNEQRIVFGVTLLTYGLYLFITGFFLRRQTRYSMKILIISVIMCILLFFCFIHIWFIATPMW